MAHKIDTPNAVAAMPAAGSAGTPGWFDDTTPGSITTLDADWCNMVQASVTTPVTDNGKALDKADPNQFATLLSGVHGTISSIRTALATTGASTYDKQSASAVTDAICSGDHSQCNAGITQTASGTQSQCNAGITQTASGDRSQCNAGNTQIASGDRSQCNAGITQTASGGCSQCNAGITQTASDLYSQCNAGITQTASGGCSQCNAGESQTASGLRSQCNAGLYQYNSGDRAIVSCGSYVENIEDDCLVLGTGTSTPPSGTYGDGLTNKNRKIVFHADTGNAEFAGDLDIGGKMSVDAATGNIATSGAADVTGKVTAGGGIETASPANATATWDTDHWEATLNEVGGRISIDFSAHSLGAGDSVRISISCNKMDSGSRVYYMMESQANVTGGADGLPVACPQGPNIPGGVIIYNIKGTLDAAATLAFDVINPV